MHIKYKYYMIKNEITIKVPARMTIWPFSRGLLKNTHVHPPPPPPPLYYKYNNLIYFQTADLYFSSVLELNSL